MTNHPGGQARGEWSDPYTAADVGEPTSGPLWSDNDERCCGLCGGPLLDGEEHVCNLEDEE